ncbi:MAG: peptide synthase [Planctomycetaceae bacterium]|nr:peptide synthase [Planctomycetaceae bacterium]|tara:strand:+ start:1430 stop:3094 length:1665 start_codon:yes stop_codon:yes gene_type:complete
MNVAEFLQIQAQQQPDAIAIAEPIKGRWANRSLSLDQRYHCLTFKQLEEDSSHLAAGLHEMGVKRGTRLALMIPPSCEFISWVFALFKAGMVSVLIDPGMGRSNIIHCLQNVETEGFIGISRVQAVRTLLKYKFPAAKKNVTVGRRWFWGGPTSQQLRQTPIEDFEVFKAEATDPAAIIFTTGSTGPPKGVHYCHQNFYHQVLQIQEQYQIKPGERDLPAFPLFGLFNAAMGVATILPVMDPTKPALVTPENIITPIQDWQVTQSFGSPALWETVGRYCSENSVNMPSLKRILSAGAPVPPRVLKRMRNAMASDGDMHTPYGATESLPVATISATEVLEETVKKTNAGQGTCVGSNFSGIQWRVIQISDGELTDINDTTEVAHGEIGELIVKGPVVTSHYVTHEQETRLHKIKDLDGFWHRLGDVGYFDKRGRFWFCGRKAHRVQIQEKTLYSIPTEAIINQHPRIYRSAVVQVDNQGVAEAAIVVECWPENKTKSPADRQQLLSEIKQLASENQLTSAITHFLVHDSLPVDIRHNAKIFREKISRWAQEKLGL